MQILTKETYQLLASQKYTEKYNQVELTTLPEEAQKYITRVYNTLGYKNSPTYAPFTVLAEQGVLQSVVMARLAKNKKGEVILNWGKPADFPVVDPNKLQFTPVKNGLRYEPYCYIKGFEDLQFLVYREDITKNDVQFDGILDNLKTLNLSLKKRSEPVSKLPKGTYQVTESHSEKTPFGPKVFFSVAEMPENSYVANKAINEWFDIGLFTPGTKFTITGYTQTSKGFLSAQVIRTAS